MLRGPGPQRRRSGRPPVADKNRVPKRVPSSADLTPDNPLKPLRIPALQSQTERPGANSATESQSMCSTVGVNGPTWESTSPSSSPMFPSTRWCMLCMNSGPASRTRRSLGNSARRVHRHLPADRGRLAGLSEPPGSPRGRRNGGPSGVSDRLAADMTDARRGQACSAAKKVRIDPVGAVQCFTTRTTTLPWSSKCATKRSTSRMLPVS